MLPCLSLRTSRALLGTTFVAWGCFLGDSARAQVDVVNGGFESHSMLPNASGQFHIVDGWTHGGGAEGMPDYYHQLGTSGGDLPQTPLAKVSALKGRAIAGFVAYTDDQNPRHEYVVGRFSEPLEVGQRYEMHFAITSGRVHDWVNAGLGVSQLGVALSIDQPTQQGHERLDLEPQFEIHEALYDREWREISFVFTATEAFEHLTLGLFGDMPNVRREESGTRTMAYYFVDDFGIEEVSNVLMSEEDLDRGERGFEPVPGMFAPNAFSPNGDDLNDTWVWSMPEGQTGQLSVVNRWGLEVWQGQLSSNLGWDGTDAAGDPMNAGMYAWRMVLDEAFEGQSVWKGWVTLVK